MKLEEAVAYKQQFQEKLDEYKNSIDYSIPALRSDKYVASLTNGIAKMDKIINQYQNYEEARRLASEAEQGNKLADRLESEANEPFALRALRGAGRSAGSIATAVPKGLSNIALGATGTVLRGLGSDTVGPALQEANRTVQNGLGELVYSPFENREGVAATVGNAAQGFAELFGTPLSAGSLASKVGNTAVKAGQAFNASDKVLKALKIGGDTLGFSANSLQDTSDRIEAQRGEFSLGRTVASDVASNLLMATAFSLGAGKGLTGEKAVEFGWSMMKKDGLKKIGKDGLKRALKTAGWNGLLNGGVGTAVKEALALPDNPTDKDISNAVDTIFKQIGHETLMGFAFGAKDAYGEYKDLKKINQSFGSTKKERYRNLSNATYNIALDKTGEKFPDLFSGKYNPEEVKNIQNEVFNNMISEANGKDRQSIKNLVDDLGTVLNSAYTYKDVGDSLKKIYGQKAPMKAVKEPLDNIVNSIKAVHGEIEKIDEQINSAKDLRAKQELGRQKEQLYNSLSSLRDRAQHPYSFDDFVKISLNIDSSTEMKQALSEFQTKYKDVSFDGETFRNVFGNLMRRFGALKNEKQGLVQKLGKALNVAKDTKEKEYSDGMNAIKGGSPTTGNIVESDGTVIPNSLKQSSSSDIANLRRLRDVGNMPSTDVRMLRLGFNGNDENTIYGNNETSPVPSLPAPEARSLRSLPDNTERSKAIGYSSPKLLTLGNGDQNTIYLGDKTPKKALPLLPTAEELSEKGMDNRIKEGASDTKKVLTPSQRAVSDLQDNYRYIRDIYARSAEKSVNAIKNEIRPTTERTKSNIDFDGSISDLFKQLHGKTYAEARKAGGKFSYEAGVTDEFLNRKLGIENYDNIDEYSRTKLKEVSQKARKLLKDRFVGGKNKLAVEAIEKYVNKRLADVSKGIKEAVKSDKTVDSASKKVVLKPANEDNNGPDKPDGTNGKKVVKNTKTNAKGSKAIRNTSSKALRNESENTPEVMENKDGYDVSFGNGVGKVSIPKKVFGNMNREEINSIVNQASEVLKANRITDAEKARAKFADLLETERLVFEREAGKAPTNSDEAVVYSKKLADLNNRMSFINYLSRNIKGETDKTTTKKSIEESIKNINYDLEKLDDTKHRDSIDSQIYKAIDDRFPNIKSIPSSEPEGRFSLYTKKDKNGNTWIFVHGDKPVNETRGNVGSMDLEGAKTELRNLIAGKKYYEAKEISDKHKQIAEEKAVEETKKSFGGFLDNKNPLQVSTAKKALAVRFTELDYNDPKKKLGTKPIKEWIDEWSNKGVLELVTGKSKGKKYYGVKRAGEKPFFQISKTAYDYAEFKKNQENPLFRKSADKTETKLPYTREQVESTLRKNVDIKKLGVDVNVVDKVSDIPDHEKLNIAKGEQPQDVTYEVGGKTYIVLGNIGDKESLDSVARHAIAGHLGGRRILGEKLYDKMSRLMVNESKKEGSEFNKLAKLIKGSDSSVTDDKVLGSELFARVMERGVENPTTLKGKMKQMWQDIKYFFKRGLRRLGYNGEITEDELSAMIRYVAKKSTVTKGNFLEGLDDNKSSVSELNSKLLDNKPAIEDVRFRKSKENDPEEQLHKHVLPVTYKDIRIASAKEVFNISDAAKESAYYKGFKDSASEALKAVTRASDKASKDSRKQDLQSIRNFNDYVTSFLDNPKDREVARKLISEARTSSEKKKAIRTIEELADTRYRRDKLKEFREMTGKSSKRKWNGFMNAELRKNVGELLTPEQTYSLLHTRGLVEGGLAKNRSRVEAAAKTWNAIEKIQRIAANAGNIISKLDAMKELDMDIPEYIRNSAKELLADKGMTKESFIESIRGDGIDSIDPVKVAKVNQILKYFNKAQDNIEAVLDENARTKVKEDRDLIAKDLLAKTTDKSRKSQNQYGVGWWKNIFKPVGAYNSLDGDNFTSLMGKEGHRVFHDDILKGYEKSESYRAKGYRAVDKIREGYGKKWKDVLSESIMKVKSVNGEEYDLTRGEAMDLYATVTDSRTAQLIAKNPERANIVLKRKTAMDVVSITPELIEQIKSRLSDQDMKAIEAMKAVLNKDFMPAINKTKETLDGYELIPTIGNDGSYWMRSAKRTGEVEGSKYFNEIGKHFTSEIHNAEWQGSAQSRKNGGKAFIIGDAMEHMEEYTDLMSHYIGMAEPMRHAMRVENGGGFRDSLTNALGREYSERLHERMKLVAGLNSDRQKESPFNRFLRFVSSNTAGSNLTPRSWLKQLTSVYLATPVIEGRYLTKGWKHMTDKSLDDEMMGTDIGYLRYRNNDPTGWMFAGNRNAEEVREYRKKMEKINKYTLGVKGFIDSASNTFDRMALRVVFAGAKAKAEAEGLTGDKLKERTNRLFSDAIYRTQNTTDIMSATGWQEDARRNVLSNFVNMYLNQAQHISNEYYRLNRMIKESESPEKKKEAKTAMMMFALSHAVALAASKGIDVMLDKVLGKKEDDKEKTSDKVFRIGSDLANDVVANPVHKFMFNFRKLGKLSKNKSERELMNDSVYGLTNVLGAGSDGASYLYDQHRRYLSGEDTDPMAKKLFKTVEEGIYNDGPVFIAQGLTGASPWIPRYLVQIMKRTGVTDSRGGKKSNGISGIKSISSLKSF